MSLYVFRLLLLCVATHIGLLYGTLAQAQNKSSNKEVLGSGMALSLGMFRGNTTKGVGSGTLVTNGIGPLVNFSLGNIYSPLRSENDNLFIWGLQMGLSAATGTSTLDNYTHGYGGISGGDNLVNASNLENRPGYKTTSQQSCIHFTGCFGTKARPFPNFTLGITLGGGIEHWTTTSTIQFQESIASGIQSRLLWGSYTGWQLSGHIESYLSYKENFFIALRGSVSDRPDIFFWPANSIGSTNSISLSIGSKVSFRK